MVGDGSLKLREVMDDNGWKLVLLRSLVEESVVATILQAGVGLREGDDVCVWEHSVDGKFTTKSTWNLIRDCLPMLEVAMAGVCACKNVDDVIQ